MMPRQSVSRQPVSRWSVRTAASPIVTSSTGEIPRDSIPVWWANFRGIVSPNQALSSLQTGSWTAMAAMPSGDDMESGMA
jgi:hypothetical protein